MPKIVITNEKGAFIIEHANDMSLEAISRCIGVCRTTVQKYIKDNGIVRDKKCAKKRINTQDANKTFTECETESIMRCYSEGVSPTTLARVFGVSQAKMQQLISTQIENQ